MQLPTLALLLLTGAAYSSPVVEIARRQNRGQYTVPGLGTRKRAILNAGGNTLDLAIAMLETETMTTNYAYGAPRSRTASDAEFHDNNKRVGDNKQNDAANFGLFKQNWGMLRVCAGRAGFMGQSQANWNNGARLNFDVYADVAARWDCQGHYGYDLWFAGHRNGASGLANPYTPDINTYKSAVQWIQRQIDGNPSHKSDDIRFWVDVTPI
ncbi:hypothetical protein NUW58_g8925 [Xylaria curta]|uniref:Uncharacterized protein n=1 Tax=Xylaria curta TaxID=42375 RepID=A0ACC1N3X3_9PEZI|nr:hypothetical protein NUW58_g8925 [Xylaria curta]